jgi:mono/diheme cytochrome c family protein
MRPTMLLRTAAALALAAILGACTQKNTADQQQDTSTVPQGLNRFLLFPNPVSMSTGGFETDTTDYADAYYRAIDPGNAKDTIDKWKTQNGFGSGTGTEQLAVFRDVKDLGYGRRMTGRMNTDGSVAFFVENYNVAPNGSASYSSELNVEAAIRRDTQWHVGTNAIEWSTTPCINLASGTSTFNYDRPNCSNTAKFAKYYNFSSVDGTRQVAVDLDGNGKKAMPGPCITCHGGRGDPLTPADASNGGKPRFPLVENSLSRKRGDVQGRLQGMNVDSFQFSTQASWTRADQEATLKAFNQWILCTYPTPGGAVLTVAGGSCTRPDANLAPNEWQGTAGPMIEAWYGGPGMPQATFLDNYVPAGWNTGATLFGTTTDTVLYKGVVAPYCRTCHIIRGTKNQNDIDFMTVGTLAAGVTPATGFLSYADRIKAHVFDRGIMPLALIVYNDFWNTPAPTMLAQYVDSVLGPQTATTTSGDALRPGRPIASPGPNRMVRTGANAILTAEDSLFASTFSWSLDPTTPGATIANPNSMIATFNAPAAGDYIVNLTVGNGAQTNSKNVTITVNDTFPDPTNLKFAHVKNVLQNVVSTTSQVTAQKCTTCHTSPPVVPTPPVFYNSTFDQDSSGAVNATDDAWFLKALQGRANLTEIEASPLLRKPSGNHHRGLMVLDVADKTSGGGLSNYSILYNWILAGMQGGGVAASAVVNAGVLGTPVSPVLFTFSGPVGGPYASPNITLDGSASLGAITTYAWSVFGPPGPLGTLPSITNSTSSIATLNVYDVGTYVVQLQVSDGTSTDTVQRTIVIGENPISASFTPATGTSQVTFSGAPVRGSITLNSTSTGSPTTCRWQVLAGPAGATLAIFPTILVDLTQSCASVATLSVPVAAVGSSYTVQLTASNIASSTVDNFIVVAAAPGQNAANADFTFPASTISFTVNGNTGNATQTRINGIATSSITLTGSANGLAPLTYSWSLPSGAGSAGCSTPASGQVTSLAVTKAGTCDVTLTVSNSLPGTSTATKTVTVSSGVTFSSVIAILGNAGTAAPGTASDCVGCHIAPGSAVQPDWTTTGGNGALLTRLQTKIDLVTPRNSLLLACPELGCDGGLMPLGRPGFVNGVNMVNYDAFLTWITNGLP